MRRRSKTGKTYYHYLVATRQNGRIVRKYLPRVRLPSVEIQIELDKRANGMMRAIRDALKTADSGRPPIMDGELRKMLSASGYTVHADKICRNRKRYFSPAAVEYRYSLLVDDLKRIIKSPADLAALERKTISRQLSYAGKGTSAKNYDVCFMEILAEANRQPI
jgi:hypothetical protein